MENNRKKILVTGACGLIGRELCKKLSLNHDVVGVDNNFRFDVGNIENYCNFISINLTDYLLQNDNDFDYIFHMSAINGTKYFYEMPNQVLENNLLSDFSVFNFAKKNSKTKLIYASSSEIVADTENYPVEEEVDITIKNIHNPRWSYRLAKIASENYLMNSDLNFLIIRFFNIYGKNSASGHFIGDIIGKINNGDYNLIGAEETRSFCYIDDAVDALEHIYDSVEREVINVGNDEEIKIIDAASVISNHLKKNVLWQSKPGLAGSTKRRLPSIEKLKIYYKEYSPRPFSEGIKQVLESETSN